MPDWHRYPAKAFRPPPELYSRAKEVVAEADSDMNAHLIGFLRWLTRETDELPSRGDPPASAVLELTGKKTPEEIAAIRKRLTATECPVCGALLDPGGRCFVCR